jgi:arylsulfatase A-like enzyme
LVRRGIPADAPALRPYSRWGQAPALDLTRAPFPADERTEQGRQIKLAIYDATIRYVDRVIGDLQATLVRRGLDSNTLVSVFSDHGEEFLDHAAFARRWGHDPRGINGIGHGHAHFQEVLHVPWLAWGPGVPVGQRVEHPVSLLDLSPTLLHWLGLAPMANLTQAATGGGELAPALIGQAQDGQAQDGQTQDGQTQDGQAASASRLLLSEAIAYGPDLVALRRGHLKLIAHRDGRVLALFDLATDPGETRDVAADQPAAVTELLGHLAHWRRSGLGAGGQAGGDWNDLDETVRRRLKDLGYSD